MNKLSNTNIGADFDFDTGTFSGGFSGSFGPEHRARRLPAYVVFIILIVALCALSAAVSYLDVLMPQWFV